ARPQRVIALGRLEDALDDELRRGRAVPGVLLETEGDVVAPRLPKAVRLRPEAEGNRRPGRPAVLAHSKPEVLAVPHGLELGPLAPGGEQPHGRVAEPERSETAELGREVEGQRPAGDDRIDDQRWAKVALREAG